MSIYEYDEERQRRFDREEGREEGRREVLIDAIRLMLEDNIPISKISRYCHTPETEIQELIKKLNTE